MRSNYMEERCSFMIGVKKALGIPKDDDQKALVVLDYLQEHGVDPSAILLRMVSAQSAADVGFKIAMAARKGINPVMATIDLERNIDDPYDDDAPFLILIDDFAWPVEPLRREGVTAREAGLHTYRDANQDLPVVDAALREAFFFVEGTPEYEWLSLRSDLGGTAQEVLEQRGINVIAFVEFVGEPLREPDKSTVEGLRLQGFLYEPGKVPDLRKIGFEFE